MTLLYFLVALYWNIKWCYFNLVNVNAIFKNTDKVEIVHIPLGHTFRRYKNDTVKRLNFKVFNILSNWTLIYLWSATLIPDFNMTAMLQWQVRPLDHLLVSISPRFYIQLLHSEIPKA
jgi:hypothetical protein